MNHLILCHPLLFLPSIFPSIRVFSNELAVHIRWQRYWSFSISPSNDYARLISFRMDWFDLLAVQGTLKSSPVSQLELAHSWRCWILSQSVFRCHSEFGKKAALVLLPAIRSGNWSKTLDLPGVSQPWFSRLLSGAAPSSLAAWCANEWMTEKPVKNHEFKFKHPFNFDFHFFSCSLWFWSIFFPLSHLCQGSFGFEDGSSFDEISLSLRFWSVKSHWMSTCWWGCGRLCRCYFSQVERPVEPT